MILRRNTLSVLVRGPKMKSLVEGTFEDGLLYIYIDKRLKKKQINKTVELKGAQVYVDIDKDNNILGIEVLNIKLDQN